MTTEEAQKLAIADLGKTLGQVLERERVTRLVAEDLQAAGQVIERQLRETRQEADALRRKLDEAEMHAASYRRLFDSLKQMHHAVVNDRDLLARRVAIAEFDLEQLQAATAWWKRWLPWT